MMMYLLFLLTLLPHITAITTDDTSIVRICTTIETSIPVGCVQLMENNAAVVTSETVDGTFSSSISRPTCTCTWKPTTCSWSCNKPSLPCPVGVSMVNCFADPCVTNPCEEGDICTANYCGGCFRKCTPKTTPTPTLSPTISPICTTMCIRPLLPPICDIFPILDISVDLSVDPTITTTSTTDIVTTERTISGLPPIDITPIVKPRPLPCRCELDECGCSYKRICPLPGPCGGNPIPKCAYPAQCLLPDLRLDQNGTIDTSISTQRCLYGCELISPCTCQFRCKPPPPICVANNMKYNVGETYQTGVKNCTICTCQADRTFECRVDTTCLGTCLIPPVCPRPICAVITPDLLTATTSTGVTTSVVDIESRVDVTGIRYCRFGCELDPTKPCECATRCKPAPICKWENRTLSFDESIIIPNTCRICRCTITGVICDIDLKCQCRSNAASAVSLCPRPVCITPDMELVATTEISNSAQTISTSTSTDLVYIPPPLVCKYGCEINITDPCTCQTICKKQPTCERDGRTYVIGQSYEPLKCQTCTCTEVGFVCTIDRLCQCQTTTRCAIPTCMTEKGGNATTGERCVYGCELDPLKPCGCDTRCLPAPTCPYNGRQVPIGFSYPDDCNTCTCTSSGNFICSKRACPVECLIDPCMQPIRDGKCTYGCRANYTIGCNFECLSPLNTTCTIKPVATIGIISCPNVCLNVRCPTNTTCITSSCTNTKCGTAVCSPIKKSTCNVTMNGVVQIYQEGDIFARECNSCTCTAAGVICTKKACIDPCPLSPPMCPAIWNPPPYCMFEFDTNVENHDGITSSINGTMQKPCVCERDPCSCGFRCKAKQPQCKWEGDGQIYQVGQTFPKDCHNCICLPNGNVTCYRRQCIPTPCIYNNMTYTAGQTFPPNCNNMECRPDGTIVVLRRVCIETCVACFVDPCRINTCPEGTVCQTPKCPQNCDYTCVAPKSCTWNNHTYAINQTFPEKCPVCQCMPNGQVDCTRDRVACSQSTGIASSTSTSTNMTSSTAPSTGLESNTTESTSSTGIDTSLSSNTSISSSSTGISSTSTIIDSSSSSTRIPSNNTCNIPLSGGAVRVYIVGETFEIVSTGICERCTCSETTRLICSIIDCRGINVNLTVSGAITKASPSISFHGLFIAMLITMMAFIRF